jgi:hypothetical protein
MQWLRDALNAVWAALTTPQALQALFGGAFGALFGAWGAQLVISRGQRKQAIITELNSVRSARVLSFAIANRFMSLKRQHVRPMRNRFVQERQLYDAFVEQAATYVGPPTILFEFRVDLQTISPIDVPIRVLEKYVFERISLNARPLAAAVDLVGAIDGLAQSIERRNSLIAEIQQGPRIESLALAKRYFGILNDEGIVDQRFADSVDAIFKQTDDCIFFAKLLGEDLLPIGAKLRRRAGFLRRFRIAKFRPVDWTIAEQANLIPPNDQYADWLRGFVRPPTFWQRLFRRAR